MKADQTIIKKKEQQKRHINYLSYENRSNPYKEKNIFFFSKERIFL